MRPRNWRPLWQSCSLFLRSSLIRRGFYATSISASSPSGDAAPAPAAPVQQFPEETKERVLQLADMFESSRKPTGGLMLALSRFRKWAKENNEPAPHNMLDLLVAMCIKTRKSSDIEIVLEYAGRHELKFTEGHMNSLIVNLAKTGSYAKVLEFCQKMEESGEKVRLTGVCAILEMAANEGDFPTMLELAKLLKVKVLAHYIYMHDNIVNTIKSVLVACRGVDDSIAMEATFELLDILRITRGKLSQEMAYVVGEWVKSSKQFALQETIVNYSGKCSGCGLTLSDGAISPDELEVLRQHMNSMLEKIISQSADIQAEQEKLKLLHTMVTATDFGMIVDGMNVAHAFQRQVPSRKLLFQMANEAVDLMGKPVLLLMRKHCISWFTTRPPLEETMASISEVYKKQGIHCFFTSNFAEDDLYLAYATVHSKPSTYLLTNDNQGSVRYYLPEDCHNVFHQWLRTRTARIIRLRRQQYNIQHMTKLFSGAPQGVAPRGKIYTSLSVTVDAGVASQEMNRTISQNVKKRDIS